MIDKLFMGNQWGRKDIFMGFFETVHGHNNFCELVVTFNLEF